MEGRKHVSFATKDSRRDISNVLLFSSLKSTPLAAGSFEHRTSARAEVILGEEVMLAFRLRNRLVETIGPPLSLWVLVGHFRQVSTPLFKPRARVERAAYSAFG
jgi:hypothetical protein